MLLLTVNETLSTIHFKLEVNAKV